MVGLLHCFGWLAISQGILIRIYRALHFEDCILARTSIDMIYDKLLQDARSQTMQLIPYL